MHRRRNPCATRRCHRALQGRQRPSAREGLEIEVDGPDERLPLQPEVEEQLYRLGQKSWPTWPARSGEQRHGPHRRRGRHRLDRGVRRRPRLRSSRRRSPTLRSAIDARPIADLGGRLQVTSTPGVVPSYASTSQPSNNGSLRPSHPDPRDGKDGAGRDDLLPGCTVHPNGRMQPPSPRRTVRAAAVGRTAMPDAV